MSGPAEIRKFLSQQDDSMARHSAGGAAGVPAPRGGEPARISEDQVHQARLAVARGSRDADDCKLLLDMLGLAPGDSGVPPVRE